MTDPKGLLLGGKERGGVLLTLLLMLVVLVGIPSFMLLRVWSRLQHPIPSLEDKPFKTVLAYKRFKQKRDVLQKNPVVKEIALTEDELTAWISESEGFRLNGAFGDLSLKVKKEGVVSRFIFYPFKFGLKEKYRFGRRVWVKLLQWFQIKRIFLKQTWRFQISRKRVYLLPKDLWIGDVEIPRTLLLMACNVFFSDLLEFELPSYVKDFQLEPGEFLVIGSDNR